MRTLIRLQQAHQWRTLHTRLEAAVLSGQTTHLLVHLGRLEEAEASLDRLVARSPLGVPARDDA